MTILVYQRKPHKMEAHQYHSLQSKVFCQLFFRKAAFPPSPPIDPTFPQGTKENSFLFFTYSNNDFHILWISRSFPSVFSTSCRKLLWKSWRLLRDSWRIGWEQQENPSIGNPEKRINPVFSAPMSADSVFFTKPMNFHVHGWGNSLEGTSVLWETWMWGWIFWKFFRIFT